MPTGKYLSLEEARKTGKIDRFAKEHPSQADERFASLLEAMVRGTPLGPQTSSQGVSGDCNGTQTPQDTSEGAGD